MRLAGVALALALALAAPARAADTGEGKSTAHASAVDVVLGDGSGGAAEILRATLKKGKKHRVLVAEASVVADDFQAGASTTQSVDLIFQVLVNGAAMEGALRHSCAPSIEAIIACSTSGVFWLDLDAAEASLPGTFLKQPLVVTLEGGAVEPASTTNPSGQATLTVRMEKR